MARNLKPIPTSLRYALEACKDHARKHYNMSVERIADAMGLPDHFALYKWISTGRMPANMIRPFEMACRANHASRFIAASAGGLFVDMPTGSKAGPAELCELQRSATDALSALMAFYDGKGDLATTLARIELAMSGFAFHDANIRKFETPELEFGA